MRHHFKINNKNLLHSPTVKIQDLSSFTKGKNKQRFDHTTGLPDTIILHYTAGSSAGSASWFFAREDVKASAHLVIGRYGNVYQLVPFDTIAWHAGKSSYGGRVGYNKYSIGIELDNAGVLEKDGDKYIAWFKEEYSEDDVIEATHRNETSPRYWHTYTEKQIEVATEITKLLVDTYGIKSILGHEEISPGRKIDPGPAFPLDKFREDILGKTPD